MTSTHFNIKDFRRLPGNINAGIWEFPAVKSINKHGKELSWQVRVWVEINAAAVPVIDAWFDSEEMPAGAHGVIGVVSGMVGGKVRAVDNTYITTGKNLGRSSATNVWTQALRDAFGMYNKQQRKADVQVAPVTEKKTCPMYPPMLAQVMGDNMPDEIAYVQPKLDGVRAVAVSCDGIVVMYSRRSKEYPALIHIKNALKDALTADVLVRGKPVYLDGEVYKHGARLQDISGATKKETTLTREFAFHVYDCFILGDGNMIFSERQKVLDEIFKTIGNTHAVVRVETVQVTTVAEARAAYDKWIAAEYEGAMYRLDLPYEFSYNERHSARLLKMKPNFDGEYEIISWTTGRRGKAADAVMINCKTSTGKEFAVTPAMTLEMRRALARKMGEIEPNGKTHFDNHWLGRPLIVTYDELSRDGVPQRARTKMIIRTWD